MGFGREMQLVISCVSLETQEVSCYCPKSCWLFWSQTEELSSLKRGIPLGNLQPVATFVPLKKKRSVQSFSV